MKWRKIFFFPFWQSIDTRLLRSFMSCHGLFKRGQAARREILHCQLSTKQANPDELKQMLQICNFEAPNPAACAIWANCFICAELHRLQRWAGCTKEYTWMVHTVGSRHQSFKNYISVTQKWQKSAIWEYKFPRKNLGMHLVWSFKLTNNRQAVLKNFSTCCSSKNSSQTLASTL